MITVIEGHLSPPPFPIFSVYFSVRWILAIVYRWLYGVQTCLRRIENYL